jgi:hypothetical protein
MSRVGFEPQSLFEQHETTFLTSRNHYREIIIIIIIVIICKMFMFYDYLSCFTHGRNSQAMAVFCLSAPRNPTASPNTTTIAVHKYDASYLSNAVSAASRDGPAG